LKLLTREGELVVPGVFVNRKFYILTVAAGRATVVGSTRQQAVWRSRALILFSFLRLELHSSHQEQHQQQICCVAVAGTTPYCHAFHKNEEVEEEVKGRSS